MRWILISLIVLMPSLAHAFCNTTGCWTIWVFSNWTRTIQNGTIVNDISVNNAYPMSCKVIRSIENVGTVLLDGTINAEIYECVADDTTMQAVDADLDYMVLFGDQIQDTSYCTDPAETNQVDCETLEYSCSSGDPQHNTQNKCQNATPPPATAGYQWVGTPRGTWIVSEGYVEALRPKSEAITSPEFSAVRNKMGQLGWNTNGVDSCIGQQANGRSRWEIMETALACIDAL